MKKAVKRISSSFILQPSSFASYPPGPRLFHRVGDGVV
jgi:hypothetical protein